jgi:hypothetical protein
MPIGARGAPSAGGVLAHRSGALCGHRGRASGRWDRRSSIFGTHLEWTSRPHASKTTPVGGTVLGDDAGDGVTLSEQGDR